LRVVGSLDRTKHPQRHQCNASRAISKIGPPTTMCCIAFPTLDTAMTYASGAQRVPLAIFPMMIVNHRSRCQ
jgi:hypothetical protein